MIGRGVRPPAIAAFAARNADHARLADAAMRLDALQLLRSDAGGSHLLEVDLGMGMEIAADGGQFIGIGVDWGKHGYGWSCWRERALD